MPGPKVSPTEHGIVTMTSVIHLMLWLIGIYITLTFTEVKNAHFESESESETWIMKMIQGLLEDITTKLDEYPIK